MKRLLVILFIVAILPAPLIAETKIGLSPAVVGFTIEDPDGNTDTYTGLQAFGLTSTHDINNKFRLMGVVNLYDFDLDASTTNIGQNVQGYRVGCYVQRIIRMARHFNFYTGLGLGYTSAEFTKRHKVDSDGYLSQTFSDRSENNFSLLLNVSKEFELSTHIDIGADISYQHSLGDGIKGIQGAINLLYKF